MSPRRLRHYGKIRLGEWAEVIRRDSIPGKLLPWSDPGSGLTSSTGIARHVNRDEVAAAVLPVREVPASLQDGRNRESGDIRAAGLVKCFAVKIEERMMRGGPVVKERSLDRGAEVRATVMLVVGRAAVATRTAAA